MQKNILLIAALALIIFGVIGLSQILISEPVSLPSGLEDDISDAVDGNSTTTPEDAQNGDQDTATTTDVTLATPEPNELITSPLVLAGKARGPWYFEASFSARLEDADGNELGVVVLQAQDEWMTTDFVPFVGTMAFDTPTTSAGTLILEKANPSGLPENAAEVRVPVRFAAQ